MSDQSGPPSPPLPPLPEVYYFPQQILQAWVEIPQFQYIEPKLTRQDYDLLILGLLKGADAHGALENCLVHWSHGRLKEADVALHASRRLNIESLNSLRQFFTALMASVTTGGGHGG